ncbi:MAG: hypothetical protein HIU81_07140 [Acidobacteria bacterium]|nr:hypothetical protein [Acidobacteriota bacterium]
MNWEIGGLPLHPLLVHLTTIAVPAATMAAIVVALWPRARKWLGVGAPIIAFVAMVSTPLSSSSGEWLEEKVRGSAALEDHVHLAKGLLPWVVALFVLLAVWWAWHHYVLPRHDVVASRPGLVKAMAIGGPALLLVASLGATFQVILIGHAGAVSVWHS